MIGRGSSDAQATEEMHRFAELRRREAPVGGLKVCFLAVQQPKFPAVLPEIGAIGATRVVVQPHLLLPGCLMRQIHDDVDAARRKWPASQWLVAKPLGPHPLLAEAVVDVANSGEGRQNRLEPDAVRN
jgi:sirohydrochlorin ferrochelatase